MAPNFPAEIDVFTVPHSRMKELVNKYTFKVQDVDYRNCHEVGTLLKELQLTLHEFKYHESIENMFIMDQLKNRLKQRHIYNSAVCNCHNDNRLQEMMALVKNGKHLWKNTIGERLTYGYELQKAFIDFVQQFLPHMEEEENIFQPLLVEHFEYDELCVLKEVVLEQHELIKDPLYQEKAELDDLPETDTAIKDFRDLEPDFCSLTGLYSTLTEICNNDVQYSDIQDLSTIPDPIIDNVNVNCLADDIEKSENDLSGAGISALPSEILIKIFRYLTPPDRGRCSQVCSSWNELVYSKPLWKNIFPIQWARGIWSYEDMNLNFTFQEEMSKNLLKSSKLDEDADIDESEESNSPESERENEYLISLITNLLPKVGLGVEMIVFDGGKGISSRLIHQVLLLCPNASHISAAYTLFDYYSLKGLHLHGGLQKLKYIDFEGSECVDDSTLAALADCLRPYSNVNCQMENIQSYCPFSKKSLSLPYFTSSNKLCPFFNTTSPVNFNSSNIQYCHYDEETPVDNVTRIEYIHTSDFEEKEFLHQDNSEIEELIYNCRYRNGQTCDAWPRNFGHSYSEDMEPTLEKLNLSGCWRVTNSGLQILLNSFALKNIESLNLSSCFNLSGEVLLTIANNCLKLQPENLTYCCNIFDGPYSTEVNGCDSIDHSLKVCCRSSYKC